MMIAILLVLLTTSLVEGLVKIVIKTGSGIFLMLYSNALINWFNWQKTFRFLFPRL